MAVQNRDTASQAKTKKVTNKTKREATAAARAGGYKDANFDFIPDADQLSREQLAAQYQAAVGIIYSVPELQPLFQQAIDEEWEPDQFKAAVQNSTWYQTNNVYARNAWAKENFGKVDGRPSADWQATLESARLDLQQEATASGAQLTPEELNALARRYVYEGWGESTRRNLMKQALSEQITYLPDNRGAAGNAGTFIDTLKESAYKNGLTYSDDWYLSAARSVEGGLRTEDDWLREQRMQAASLFPSYKKQIDSGVSVQDIASPYINIMAQEWELDPTNINLDTPEIRQALMGNTGEDGSWSPTGLWDFQKKLRKDPRWMNTSKAQNDVTSVTGRVMQMFGLMGG